MSVSLCRAALDGALGQLLTQTPNHYVQKALAPCSDVLPITPEAPSKHFSALLPSTYWVFKHTGLSLTSLISTGLQGTLTWPASQPLSEVTLK